MLKIFTSFNKIWEACEYFGAGRRLNGVAAEWPKWQVRQANIWAEIYRMLWSEEFLESSLEERTNRPLENQNKDIHNNGLQNVRDIKQSFKDQKRFLTHIEIILLVFWISVPIFWFTSNHFRFLKNQHPPNKNIDVKSFWKVLAPFCYFCLWLKNWKSPKITFTISRLLVIFCYVLKWASTDQKTTACGTTQAFSQLVKIIQAVNQKTTIIQNLVSL